MSFETRPVLSRHARFRWDELRQQHQIVFPEGVLVLNETGAAIVRLCDGRPISDVIAALDSLVAQKIEALAICLLWSFKNPAHEQRIKQIAQERNPELFITASSDLVPLMREYERANTTAINCFLGPTLDHYLKDIERALNAENYGKGFLVMQSVGGLSPAAEIRRTPITTLLSGPVGGVVATQQLGRLIGEENLISTDMGGTSFDVGLIVEGAPQSTPITVMERNIVMYPAIDIITVGAGGGSRIWLDDAMTLKVGPMSQGSMPGPAWAANTPLDFPRLTRE